MSDQVYKVEGLRGICSFMRELAVATDSTLLVMVVVASLEVADDEGRHGPSLTPTKATKATKATNATVNEFRKIMVMKD